MRIVNTTNAPLFCSYTTKSGTGRTLVSGQMSADLPFDTLSLPLLWKDIGAGKIAIRLSEEDRKHVERILKADEQPIIIGQLKAKVKELKRGRGRPAKVEDNPKPKLAPGTPDWSEQNEKAELAKKAILHQPGSLADITARNAQLTASQQKARDISQSMHSRV